MAEAAKQRVLFVDDEPRLLDGLSLSLRKQRKIWDMHFACGGQAALDLLAGGRFDVVVSDMRMPGVDGEAVLRHVQREHPGTVRIVLSGQTDPAVARRMVYVAHRFLAKPCGADELRLSIERACELRSLLGSERLRELVGGIGRLVPSPPLYARLTSLLEADEVDLDRVADLVERDAAVAAKVLHIANSAFFGAARNVTSVRRAVRMLGSDAVKALVLSAETSPQRPPPADCPELDSAALMRHAALSARIARRLGEATDDTFAAGILHPIGMLALAQRAPEDYAEVLRETRASGRPLYAVERERFGVSHGAVGAYLLGLWGLPQPVVEAVFRQHEPGGEGEPLGAVLHLACALAGDGHPCGAGLAPNEALAARVAAGGLEGARTTAEAERARHDEGMS